jgi:hypothetical protein
MTLGKSLRRLEIKRKRDVISFRRIELLNQEVTMTRLRKEFREMVDPRMCKELWRPLDMCLDPVMEETQANRYSKHFFGQHHLKSLILFQITDGKSLEDLHGAMTENLLFKIHAHCPDISKSQLSRANSRRPVEAFHRIFLSLVDQLPHQRKLPASLKDLMEQIRIFDGTFLPLNPNHSPWAIYRHQFSRPDAGMRMTLRMSLKAEFPDQVFIHPYRDNSANYFRDCIDLTKEGFLYLFDREYSDHQIYREINASGNFFITRMKTTAFGEVIKTNKTPKHFRNGLKILSDEIVLLGLRKKNRLQVPLRRIRAITREGAELIFLTNLLNLAASTVASIYRLRWKIEVFFKWVKQHLKIKQFISYSLNGILLQIYSALILYLLLTLFKHANRLKMSLFDLLRKIKAKLVVFNPMIVIHPRELKLPDLCLTPLPQPLTEDG